MTHFIDLLARSCRIFLQHAFPEGESTIPSQKRHFLSLTPEQPLEPLLAAPICQSLPASSGLKGYAFRLGCAWYPHLKLQAVQHEQEWVFSVDTHDQISVPPDHPDATKLAQLQQTNQQLKQLIEQAWEAEGLLTFNALLRRELNNLPGEE